MAREFVRHTLPEWGVGRAVDEALLVVTELAANAVLHAESPYRGPALGRAGGVLRIEVADGGAGTPEPQPFSADRRERPRGRARLGARASWGIDTEGRTGKVTWAELAID